MTNTDKNIKEKTTEEAVKFKGKYIEAVGKRKTSTAQVRLYKSGTGVIMVNDMKMSKYFTPSDSMIVNQILKLTGHHRDLNFSIKTSGGGKHAQAQAIMQGMARALVESDEELRAVIKTKGWMTRDARKKERKKPGLKKARRAPQWAKR